MKTARPLLPLRLPVLLCAVLLCCLAAAVTGTSPATCALQSSCTTCAAVSGCGWCNQNKACVPGSATGPTTGVCSEGWAYLTSVAGFASVGYPINPQSIDVYLLPNQALTLTFEVTVPLSDDLPLDVMFIQDTSGSMSDDLEALHELTPLLGNGIKAFQTQTRFGLGSFIDIPSAPAGGGGYKNIWRYRLETQLESSFLFMQNKILGLSATGNYDAPESSLDGLMFSMACKDTGNKNDPGWNPNARKIFLLITDDFAKCSPECGVGYKDANQALDDPRRGASGTDPRTPTNVNAKPSLTQTYSCTQTDWTNSGTPQAYLPPSQATLISMLTSYDIIPIFMLGDPLSSMAGQCYSGISTPISACPATQTNLQARYNYLVQLLGFGATGTFVLDQTQASKTALLNSILWAIQNVSSQLALTVSSDPNSLVSAGPVPSGCSATNLCKGIYYTNALEGQTYSFTVTLLTTSTITANTSITLHATGLGDNAISTINVVYYLITCVGCDGKLNSNKVDDPCGVCGGNSSTCTDCYGNVITNGAPLTMDDSCGVCGGNGQSCLGCDNIPYPPPLVKTTWDLCGICNGTNACLDCKGWPFGSNSTDLCGVCDGTNACIACDGVAYPPPAVGPVVDACGVCGGTNITCRDCNGRKPGQPGYNASLSFDLCNVCGGNNSCIGCDGNPNSGKVVDKCGICGGSNTCIGCDGVPNSYKIYDQCGVCGGNNTCLGCDGVPNSGLKVDSCGICGGNNKTCYDCSGAKYGTLIYDRCGVCGGNNSCVGCDNVPNSGMVVDSCGVCGGVNGCAGCDGVANSGKWYDLCGVCGGNNTCLGCDGVPYSGWAKDSCGTCCNNVTDPAGCNQCKDCAGNPFGGKVIDLCGVCGGNNTCVGCDGIPYSGLVYDNCSICGGDNSCVDCLGVPNGPGSYDICGVCYNRTATQTHNLTCLDCYEIPFGTAKLDACDVCGGDNSTCTGCDGKVYPNYDMPIDDLCGVCNGTNACAGCDGVVPLNGHPKKVYDRCGVCGGLDLCVGCDNVTNSGLVADVCGNCPGNPSACYACNGVPKTLPTAESLDACGICGGKATSVSECSHSATKRNTVIGASVGAGVAAVVGLFALMLLALYAKNPNFLIQDVIDGNEVVGVNPLYESAGREQFNQLYMGK